jgi:hypothetical protein
MVVTNPHTLLSFPDTDPVQSGHITSCKNLQRDGHNGAFPEVYCDGLPSVVHDACACDIPAPPSPDTTKTTGEDREPPPASAATDVGASSSQEEDSSSSEEDLDKEMGISGIKIDKGGKKGSGAKSSKKKKKGGKKSGKKGQDKGEKKKTVVSETSEYVSCSNEIGAGMCSICGPGSCVTKEGAIVDVMGTVQTCATLQLYAGSYYVDGSIDCHQAKQSVHNQRHCHCSVPMYQSRRSLLRGN